MRDSQDNPGVIAKPPTIYSAAVVVVLVLQFMAPLPITLVPVRLWIGLSVIVLGGVWGILYTERVPELRDF